MANPPEPAPAGPTPTHVAHDPVSQTLALLRPWIEYVPQQQRRLGLFICLALAIHATMFFFLTIDNSVARMQRQVRTYVSVDYPSLASGESANQYWDQLTDPRVFLLPQNPPDDLAAEIPPLAINSPIGTGTLPEAALPAAYQAGQSAVSPLEQQVAQAMSPPRQTFVYDETPPAMATKTTWQWDDVLAQRHPAGVPDLPSPVSDTDLSPTKLRIAVDPSGAVEHVLVEQSSGGEGASIAKDLDQQAVLAAKKLRFQPTEQPGLQWGRITIFWRYSAKPREEVVPTPPAPGP
jgi:TonB family protein